MDAAHVLQPARPFVVVVEDEPDVGRLVVFNLRAADLEVVLVDTAAAALAEVARRPPTVLLVDRMLPDGDGIDLCARVRREPRLEDVAILVLSACGSEQDRLDGFAVGADDYVVKPFSVRELVARVRVLVTLATDRRVARASTEAGEKLRWRNVVVDVASHRVFAAGAEIELRPLELKLLLVLFEAGGALLTRGEVLRKVWSEDPEAHPRLVDVLVWRVRKRLGEHGEIVETVRGGGYRLAAE